MREEVEELEKLRDEYIHRNAEQGEMITSFMTQIGSLQDELKQLAQAQLRTNDLVKQRDKALEKERMLKDELKKKYKVESDSERAIFLQFIKLLKNLGQTFFLPPIMLTW